MISELRQVVLLRNVSMQGLIKPLTAQIVTIIEMSQWPRELLEDRGAVLMREIDDQFTVKLIIEPKEVTPRGYNVT